MNAYRFAVRTCCKDRYTSPLAIDLAVSLPPEQLEPLLDHHRLVDGVAIGLLDTEAAARAAHNDLVFMTQLVDALGLAPAEDQSVIYRNRKLGQTFDRPLVLVDGDGDIAVLDRREPMPEKNWADYVTRNPLSAFGWVAATLSTAVFSDGTAAQISSQEIDVSALVDRVDGRLGEDSYKVIEPELIARLAHEERIAAFRV
jgi:hypothetical protein